MCEANRTPSLQMGSPFSIPFDITMLGSQTLTDLFRETASHIQGIRLERVGSECSHRGLEKHPAQTIGFDAQHPTVRFATSLNPEDQIEAIGHELGHLLLVYGHGLRVIDRRIGPRGGKQDLFDYCLNLRRYWNYFLGQVVNTVHHRILPDYLKERYGIGSGLHLKLFRHNFRVLMIEDYRDRESQYAKGLAAFEYEGGDGIRDRLAPFAHQSQFFWKAYHAAQKYFGGYSFKTIPMPSTYEAEAFSFLEDLGYNREDFFFLPKGMDKGGGDTGSSDPFTALPPGESES